MVNVGIEALNAFGGTAYIDVMELAEHRGLDTRRFDNLLMKEKAVTLPIEDPVTYAVNAAKPIVDALPPEEKDRIELVITCTESGVDFGKSMSTYIHHYLGLKRNCRLFEIKQACYAGTAGFQMAVNFILSQASPGAKALVVTTDITRFMVVGNDWQDGASTGPQTGEDETLTQDWSFAEPSSGAGAVAMLVSETPYIFQVDVGANGYYGYEVMDSCRPIPDSEAGDSDLSLMSYLDCCENAFLEYQKRVDGAHYQDSFQYLSFHTPFGGMVKGAHRSMMRKQLKAKPADIEIDFKNRVEPGLDFCQRVGNIMGGTVFLNLASTIAHGEFDTAKRIGCFSYGSGCCSEFYSGVVTTEGHQVLKNANIIASLDSRLKQTMSEYDNLLSASRLVKFGTRNIKLDWEPYANITDSPAGQHKLFLKEINEFHREYVWNS